MILTFSLPWKKGLNTELFASLFNHLSLSDARLEHLYPIVAVDAGNEAKGFVFVEESYPLISTVTQLAVFGHKARRYAASLLTWGYPSEGGGLQLGRSEQASDATEDGGSPLLAILTADSNLCYIGFHHVILSGDGKIGWVDPNQVEVSCSKEDIETLALGVGFRDFPRKERLHQLQILRKLLQETGACGLGAPPARSNVMPRPAPALMPDGSEPVAMPA